LVVIHSEKLSFLRSTELKARDQVDAESEDGGHYKGIGAAGYNVGDLDVELFVVVVEPTTSDDSSVDTVEADNVVGAEKGVENEANDTSDTVLSEHIHTVVNADPELNCEELVLEL